MVTRRKAKPNQKFYCVLDTPQGLVYAVFEHLERKKPHVYVEKISRDDIRADLKGAVRKNKNRNI